jgi:hypothetical protein
MGGGNGKGKDAGGGGDIDRDSRGKNADIVKVWGKVSTRSRLNIRRTASLSAFCLALPRSRKEDSIPFCILALPVPS